MRPALLFTVLLLIPLVQGFNPTVPESNMLGSEYILELDENHWDQNMWDSLEGSGHTPLRVVTPNQILVWRSGTYTPSSVFETHNAPAPEIKGLVGGSGVEHVKIVFEPRLPEDAVHQLLRAFEAVNFNINPNVDAYSTPMPHTEVIEWRTFARHPHLHTLDGVLWIEPVLETVGRNSLAASLIQHGKTSANPAWELGLNGTGIVVAAADSGIDYDHACFRNATSIGEVGSNGTDGVGEPGGSHRKILAVNHTIDSGDTNGHSDYRHGTHVAGTLSCYNVYNMRSNTEPKNGSALAHESMLVFQDIVSDEGWVPPDVDALFVEAGTHGAVIHSNSWGDATTEYTARTADFDAWALEMPWSLAFVAPGNNGGQLLEPANGRNVVAVGASVKSPSMSVWPSSSIGPTEAGTNGIFALAPGTSIQSARADGIPDSYNDALRSSSGTSMSTPAAAGVAAILQQLVEDGWISGYESRTATPVSQLRPVWADPLLNSSNNLELAEGFTPSGALLRSLLALSTTQLSQQERNGGEGGYQLQNEHDGWGQLNLSELIDLAAVEYALHRGNVSPTSDLWIHDSYRLVDKSPAEWLVQRNGTDGALENLHAMPWNATDAAGPFLKTGEQWTKRFELNGEHLDVRLAWPSSPEPYLVQDLQLIVRLSDGTEALAGEFQSDGDSTLFFSNVVDFSNTTSFPNRNETTVAVSLSPEDLTGIEWVDIEVRARYITPGNQQGSVGIDGDRQGFALAVKGVHRDSQAWSDDDGDGVANAVDGCPNENARDWDVNEDGCIDDSDGDSVNDANDVCPEQHSLNFDANNDGCIDDTDGDGVLDNLDRCFTEVVTIFWPVDSNGCRPVDSLPVVDFVLSPQDGGVWYDELVVEWVAHDVEGDAFDTGASIQVVNLSDTSNAYPIASCTKTNVQNGTFSCLWEIPNDLPVWDIRGQPLQIEIFIQSRNGSPEAKRDTVLVRDEATFTSEWNNPLLEVEDEVREGVQGRASQTRALMWGVFGILGGILVMYQLGWNVRHTSPNQKRVPAFAVDTAGYDGQEADENE